MFESIKGIYYIAITKSTPRCSDKVIFVKNDDIKSSVTYSATAHTINLIRYVDLRVLNKHVRVLF